MNIPPLHNSTLYDAPVVAQVTFYLEVIGNSFIIVLSLLMLVLVIFKNVDKRKNPVKQKSLLLYGVILTRVSTSIVNILRNIPSYGHQISCYLQVLLNWPLMIMMLALGMFGIIRFLSRARQQSIVQKLLTLINREDNESAGSTTFSIDEDDAEQRRADEVRLQQVLDDHAQGKADIPLPSARPVNEDSSPEKFATPILRHAPIGLEYVMPNSPPKNETLSYTQPSPPVQGANNASPNNNNNPNNIINNNNNLSSIVSYNGEQLILQQQQQQQEHHDDEHQHHSQHDEHDHDQHHHDTSSVTSHEDHHHDYEHHSLMIHQKLQQMRQQLAHVPSHSVENSSFTASDITRRGSQGPLPMVVRRDSVIQRLTFKLQEIVRKHSQLSKEAKRVKVRANMLKFLASPLFFVASVIIIFILYYFITCTVFFSMIERMSFAERCVTVQITSLVAMIILGAIGLVFVIIDVVSFVDKIRKCQFHMPLCSDDPFLYRMEAYFFIVVFSISVISTLVLTIPVVASPGAELAIVCIKILTSFLILCIYPGIALCVTFEHDIAERRLKKIAAKMPKNVPSFKHFSPKLETVQAIMLTPKTAKMFKDFATKEFNVENILFYMEVQNWREISEYKQVKRFKIAHRIYVTFLDPSSVMEVNITNMLKEAVRKKLFMAVSTSVLPEDIFDDCERSVTNNLIDMYTRFFRSTEFQSYIKSLPNTD